MRGATSDLDCAALKRLHSELFFPTEGALPISVDRGLGSRFRDHDGRTYVDFGAGLACLPFGYSDPETLRTIQSQCEKLIHSGSEVINAESIALLELLDGLRPGSAYFFSCSGAEANEAAFKLARKHSACDRKRTIVGMRNSFHGRTQLNISVSGNAPHTIGYEPLVPDVMQLPFNDCEALEAAAGPEVCAIAVEVVQGRGGGHEISRDFVDALHRVRSRHGTLIIVDDIQTGIGRLGTVFGHESYGLDPDIVTVAKGLGGGLPIGLTIARRSIARAMGVGTHGNTFGGNPMVAAVANRVLSRISTPDFLAQVQARSRHLIRLLDQMRTRSRCFEAIRGKGLMLTAELGGAYAGCAAQIKNAAACEGVLVRTAGDSMLRFTPALNIPESDIEDGMERLERAIAGFDAACGIPHSDPETSPVQC